MLKKLVLPITILYTIALASVSLIRLSNIPDVGVSYADKIYHFSAYFLLTILWFNTIFKTFKCFKNKSLILSITVSVVFGIFIEVLQDVATNSRSLDVYDILANTLGALLAATLLKLKKNRLKN